MQYLINKWYIMTNRYRTTTNDYYVIEFESNFVRVNRPCCMFYIYWINEPRLVGIRVPTT